MTVVNFPKLVSPQPSLPGLPAVPIHPSRLEFERARQAFIAAWVLEVQRLSRAERNQDIADTMGAMVQLAAFYPCEEERS